MAGLLFVVLLAGCAGIRSSHEGVRDDAQAGAIRVDARYPGGNIAVEHIEENTVYLAPDQRDTQTNQWWFYWNFRLRAPAEMPVNVVFAGRNPIGVRGPARSTDGGITWQWLGAEAVKSSPPGSNSAWSFVARVPKGAREVRYAFAPPYQQSHLRAWLRQYSDQPALRVERLCRSRSGRSVELLRAGCLDRERSDGIVLLTSRHHCCESMATYALEGFLQAVLADDDCGKRWRAHWEVIAVPFVDKDGVEEGDQGKFRTPHDHNRDYNARPLYPEVTALMKRGTALKNRIVAAIDLHCPHIRGEWNDRVYLVGSRHAGLWKQQQAFAATWERLQTGSIRFRAKDCLPYGTGWNKGANFEQGRSFSAWACDTLSDARLVTTVEIAYADALGDEVNAESSRALGRDMARAVATFLSAPAVAE